MATPFSAGGGGPRRGPLRRAASALLAPLRVLGVVRSTGGQVKQLLEEACEIDVATGGASADCANDGAVRLAARELGGLLRAALTGKADARGAGAGGAEGAGGEGARMEAGWESRGSTSAFRRTLEVWRFSLGAVFKVLKANKVRAGGRARCVGARVRVLCRRACVCCDVTGACRVSVPCTRRRAVCAGIVAEEGSVGCLPAGALMCARALHSSFAKHFTNQTKPGWILRRLSTRAGGQEALLRRRLGRGAAARGQGGGRVA